MENSDSGSGPLIGDLTGIGKVVNSEIARRSYEDAASPAMREIGKLSEDTLKTFRLFTAPFQLAAAYQDRFSAFCERVRSHVPEERQREAPPEIVRPVMEAFASTSDDSPLMTMFEELMARAIDVDEADKLSPEFPKIIQSLSPLEAKLIRALTESNQVADTIMDQKQGMIVRLLRTNFNYADFGGHSHHLTLVQNLIEKRIVSSLQSRIDKQEYESLTIGSDVTLKRSTIRLTMFGKWFAESCIQPPKRPLRAK